MSPRHVATIKLIILLICAGLLLFALLKGGERFAIAGALLYFSMEIFELALEYHDAKLFRAGVWELNENKSVIEHLAAWLRGLLLFGGLFLMLGLEKERNGFSISGAIIWIGTIVCWLIAGWIVREVAGVPVRMGYGGWRVHRTRNRRRGSHK